MSAFENDGLALLKPELLRKYLTIWQHPRNNGANQWWRSRGHHSDSASHDLCVIPSLNGVVSRVVGSQGVMPKTAFHLTVVPVALWVTGGSLA